MADVLDRLARGERMAEPVGVVVATRRRDPGGGVPDGPDGRPHDHHTTDGSPRDMEDARREGVATVEDYAALRRREVVAAMDALGAAPELVLLAPDKESVLTAPRSGPAVPGPAGARAVIHPR
jgi:hypothetical protein